MNTTHDIPRRGLEILDKVRMLHDPIRAASDQIEKSGRLPESIVEQLKNANVFGMAMPEAMGGVEADPVTQLAVIEALSVADGSTGWVAMIGSDGGFYAAHLPEEAASKLFADHNTIIASTLVPRGKARAVDGGYVVTGQWPFGSAGLHAEWFGGGCLVVDENGPVTNDAGHPIMLTMFFPESDVRVHNNWQTTGLAGSGSNDWSVDAAFVPESRTMSLFEPARFDTPLFRYPWFLVANAPGVSLGIARASIEALCTVAAEKLVLPTGEKLQDDLLLQTAVGRAEAELGAARSYIYETTAALFAAYCSGSEASLAERAAFRLAGINAFHASKNVVGRMYEAAGGSALYSKSPLDRHLRDIATITQHAFANERGYGEGGRAMMGLDPQSVML